MKPNEILRYCLKNLDGSTLVESWGEKGIFRVNLGVRKGPFLKLFGAVPKRPVVGGIVEMDYDFYVADRILPHPVYAWMSWLRVLNPSEDTFETWKPYIQEACEYAEEKFAKRKDK